MGPTLFDLAGKIAVVTGASRGIGLAEHGANVALVARDRAGCDDTRQQVEALGRRAVSYSCDIADAPAVDKLAKKIENEFGGVDILVNIAGITARIW
jgi:NAD(P)-dependent dehydrogenase (short-subunit alcohol dehydrogenase family)